MSVGVACPTSSTLLLRLRVRLSQLLLWGSLVFSRTCYRPCIFVNSQSFMLCVSFLLYLEFSTRVLQDFVQAGDLYSKARERRNTFQKKKRGKTTSVEYSWCPAHLSYVFPSCDREGRVSRCSPPSSWPLFSPDIYGRVRPVRSYAALLGFGVLTWGPEPPVRSDFPNLEYSRNEKDYPKPDLNAFARSLLVSVLQAGLQFARTGLWGERGGRVFRVAQ